MIENIKPSERVKEIKDAIDKIEPHPHAWIEAILVYLDELDDKRGSL